MTDLHLPKAPMFGYYGGKQRMASKIVPLLPPHAIYVEPFCGAGAVLFAKGVPPGNSQYYREVLNDKNELLINFFRVMQNTKKRAQLFDRLEYTLYSKSEYSLACKICKSPITDSVESAWAWFVNIEMSFAHGFCKGWGTQLYSENKAVTFLNKKKCLAEITKRFERVFIESIDALDCIKKWDSPETVFYVDPPYPDTQQGHYSGYTQTDFENLLSALKSIQGAAVLSCYPNAAVPADWRLYQFDAVMSASNRKERKSADTKRTECVWVKPSMADRRADLLVPISNNNLFLRRKIPEQMSLFDVGN